jgi:DHA1 family multidrug resistance protein-like MFS transporter
MFNNARPIMYGTIRDSPFGQIVRLLTGQKYFKYAEERHDFQHPYYPRPFQEQTKLESSLADAASITTPDVVHTLGSSTNGSQQDATAAKSTTEEDDDVENPIERVVTRQSIHENARRRRSSIKPTQTSDGTILVDWYTTGMSLSSFADDRFRQE